MLARATVGAHGQLRELALDPRIYQTTTSAALAETITETIRAAAGGTASHSVDENNAVVLRPATGSR